MAQLIEQSYRESTWRINTQGAYVTSLQADGRELLFPRQLLAKKDRGGLFPCIPQFGPDGREEAHRQPQHGYGRREMWQMGKNRKAGAYLTQICRTGEYTGLESQVSYRFNRVPNRYTSLFAQLVLHNDSDTVMRVAPAFHPYFDVSLLSPEEIYEMQHGLKDAPTVSANQARMKVAPDTNIHIETKGFQKLTWWSDGLGPYICIEPSLAGPLFAERPDDPTDAEIMEPGDIRTYEMNITWIPAGSNAFVRNKPSLHGDKPR